MFQNSKFKRIITHVCCITILFFFTGISSAQVPSDFADTLESKNVKLILNYKKVSKEEGDATNAEIAQYMIDNVKDEISPIFDYRQMAKDIMYKNWNEVEEDVKDEFVKSLQMYVEVRYGIILMSMRNETITRKNIISVRTGEYLLSYNIKGLPSSHSIGYLFRYNHDDIPMLTDITLGSRSIITQSLVTIYNKALSEDSVDSFFDYIKNTSQFIIDADKKSTNGQNQENLNDENLYGDSLYNDNLYDENENIENENENINEN